MNRKLKTAIYMLADVISVAAAWILASLLLSYDTGVIVKYTWYYFLIGITVALVFNTIFGLNSVLNYYAGLADALRVVASAAIFEAYLVFVAIISVEIEAAWAVIAFFVYLSMLGVSRFLFRIISMVRNYKKISHAKIEGKRVIVIGAGSAGDMLIREMKNSKELKMVPVCVLDDDKNKIGQRIEGVHVTGKCSEVNFHAKKYNADEIIVAMPSANKKRLSKIISECQKTGCKVRVVPGVYQLANGQVSVSSAKDVSIHDLLGREQVKINLDEIMGYIKDKVVLVTGGGGSIGSELCRQIAGYNPKQLIIVDIYENNAYDIQQELLRRHKNLNLLTLIASVRDSKKIDNIFNNYKPDIVFHAAAHKHVPLMETSPNEAVKNNVSGTYKVADAAGRNGVKRFILISTDKAVNPTNIMGATKRICEMIIQTMNKRYDTEYVAVRFGNVLGSNGSVIPLFRQQIEEGGPITVTHKDIVRYFMTIPEAVCLVLQAGAYAKGGEIFVLDMGEPVRIYDLAINMIKLSGLEPNKDIEVKITGLRPGEKLYEDRLMEEEGLQKTANEMISIGKPIEIDETNLFNKIQELYVEAYNETERMKELVHELVPTYKIDKRED